MNVKASAMIGAALLFLSTAIGHGEDHANIATFVPLKWSTRQKVQALVKPLLEMIAPLLSVRLINEAFGVAVISSLLPRYQVSSEL